MHSNNPTFYFGVCESRMDPLMVGRLKVRIVGLHTHDKALLPTEDLPWAYPIQPITSGSISGIGISPLGIVEGTWVIVQFVDVDQQMPFVLGTIGGIPKSGNVPIDSFSLQYTNDNIRQEEQVVTPQEAHDNKKVRQASEFSLVSSDLIAKNGLDANKVAKAETQVKTGVRALLTQEMYDALVSLAYHTTLDNDRAFTSSSVVTELNVARYENAAANFVNQSGKQSQREKEKNWFLRGGIPTSLNHVDATPQSDQANVVPYTREPFNGAIGFKDPNDVYPRLDHINEPDTNRLSRHQKISETVVISKEVAEHKNVPKANGGDWNQSSTPYNAIYPYNMVFESESGHIIEIDDTPGHERTHYYHRTGTFTEIDHNGTQVNRVVGDNYQIYERNGYVHVVGNCHVCVDGAKTLRIENTLDVEVHGQTVINLHDNAKLNAGKNLDLSVKDNLNVFAGNINMRASNSFFINAGGRYAVDASRIDWNSGVANTPTLSTISAKSGTAINIASLTVNTRGNEAAMMYETPDDGSAEEIEAHKSQRIAEGTLTLDDANTKIKPSQKQEILPSNVAEIPVECSGVVEGQTTFNYSERISKYFTLADLTHGGSRKLVATRGYRADQIYCHLKKLAINTLDIIKERYPNVVINSGIRLDSTKSQHNIGQAVDISFPGLTREQLYYRVLEIQKMIPYDQLLLEFAKGPGWIHISYNENNNRQQVFTMNNHNRISAIGTFVMVS